MNDHYLRTATCLFAGLGYSVWRKRGLNTVRYYLRENGYVSRITEEHALRIISNSRTLTGRGDVSAAGY